MANYKEIKGLTVQNLSTDPTLNTEGQVWFNSSSGKLKSLVQIAGWSSSSAMNTGRKGGDFSFGTQTAAIIAGGTPPTAGLSEEYNGGGWSNLPTINSVRYGGAGAGTTTAGLIMGSADPTPFAPATETYDGTSWATVNVLNTGHGNSAGGGVQNAAWVAGGASPSLTQVTEEFDGTNWAAGGSMTSTARYGLFGVGPLTTAIAGGGQYPPGTQFDLSEEYDGSSWSTGGTIGDSRGWAGSSGDSSAAIIFGGNPGAGTYTTAETEIYDGAAWSTSPASMGTARNDLYSAGTTTSAALVAGGEPVPISAYTEEYNVSFNVRTGGAWATGGNLTAAAGNRASAGPSTVTLAFGGNAPTASGVTETYDGTTWTEVSDLNTARSGLAGCGTQTAALAFGGTPPITGATEEWRGSAWVSNPSPGGDMTDPRNLLGGCGIQTLALAAGGNSPGATANSEEYNGTTWSEESNLNTAREKLFMVGTQTAAVAFGGTPASTEEYDGSSWAAGNAMIKAVAGQVGMGGAGIQTNAIGFGGGSGSPNVSSATEGYDGTNWSTRPSMGTARYNIAGAGTAAAGLAIGGQIGALSNATEEFTGETETATASIITSS